MPTSRSTARILVELEDIADDVLTARFGTDFLLASVTDDRHLERISHIKGLLVLTNKALVEFAAELRQTDIDDQDAA